MSKTLQCPECGFTRPRPITIHGDPAPGPFDCPHCKLVLLVDRDTLRREDIDSGPDVMEVDSQEEAESYDQEAVTFDADAGMAYINVIALLDLTGVDDTPMNRNLTVAPLAAAVKQWGFDPVLVGLDESA